MPDGMESGVSFRGRCAAWLREPLLHFLVLGAVLFAAYAALDGDSAAPREIVVDPARVAALENRFRQTWQRSPGPAERQALIDDWVREEILYREGLALGLDRDDPVVRNHIARKFAFITGEAAPVEPSESELRAWFAERAQDYRIEPVLSFRQILIDRAADPAGAARLVEAYRERLRRGAAADALGTVTLLAHRWVATPADEVRRVFGAQFAAALLELQPEAGAWQGPVESSYGVHLVELSERLEARMPPFEAVRADIERDFVQAQIEARNRARDTRLRAEYRVTVLD